MKRRAYVGLGANLGDAADTLLRAAAEIAAWPEVAQVRGSSLYRSAPVDAGGPDFWNAVLAFDTAMRPALLLDALQAIEQRHGRERPFHHAPRTLDLDLLALGDVSESTLKLTLPHPRLQQRAFVLHPLLEVAPELSLPGLGPLSRFLPTVADQRIDRSPRQLLSSK